MAPVNAVERAAERLPPTPRARLRLLKKVLRGDLVLRQIDANVPRDAVVVDVGANRGVYTLRMSRLVGPLGRVHAVEPFPPNVASLDAIAARQRNVVVHPVALSETAGARSLSVPVLDGRSVDALATLRAVEGDCDHVDVPVARLDDIIGGDRDRVRFVKCDVEGHELAVLRGARRLLEHRPVLLVEIEQRQGDLDATFDLLSSAGYDGWAVTPAGLRPLAEFDVQRDQLDHLPGAPAGGPVTPDYVNNFLFAPG
jgi:FkbM family methyltransferase